MREKKEQEELEAARKAKLKRNGSSIPRIPKLGGESSKHDKNNNDRDKNSTPPKMPIDSSKKTQKQSAEPSQMSRLDQRSSSDRKYDKPLNSKPKSTENGQSANSKLRDCLLKSETSPPTFQNPSLPNSLSKVLPSNGLLKSKEPSSKSVSNGGKSSSSTMNNTKPQPSTSKDVTKTREFPPRDLQKPRDFPPKDLLRTREFPPRDLKRPREFPPRDMKRGSSQQQMQMKKRKCKLILFECKNIIKFFFHTQVEL